MNLELITHEAATDRLAAHLADQDAFLIVVGPTITDEASDRIVCLPTWTGYLIDDRGTVTVSNSIEALALQRLLCIALGAQTQIVFTVPKTVPATEVGAALHQEIPADGSRDVLICSPKDAPVVWPMVFVEALRRIDPRMVATLEANSLANLS